MREFKDVFQEIPGLPPSIKIEFIIDLASVSRPIARVPYRTDPSKMRELREQI